MPLKVRQITVEGIGQIQQADLMQDDQQSEASGCLREAIKAEQLQPPPPIVPRFGDAVCWYVNGYRQTGIFLGHTAGAKPVVRTGSGYTFALESFEQLRWSDPTVRSGPIWLPTSGAFPVFRPTVEERREFLRLLSRHIPPGPTYSELIEEIWHRGYEVFVVGGTVRDVISKQRTNDVDLVTTMPLERAVPLLKSMYRRDPQVHGPNGYVRLGGTPASGDPFIDLKSFVVADPGTEQAIFGGDFYTDIKHRDFACNCVYYDPVNNVLIDPTGRGIRDAETKLLEVVCDKTRPPFHKGQIVVRAIKFRSRGFSYDVQTLNCLQTHFLPGVSAMPRSDLIDYVERQMFGKVSVSERSQVASSLEVLVCEACGAEMWKDVFAPMLALIPNGEDHQ